MKKRLLAIMNNNGKYLAEFEPSGGRVLAYTTSWHEAFEHALKVDWDAIEDDEENTKRLKFWADSVEAKLVVIEMEYQVTELESGEPREECIAFADFASGAEEIGDLINMLKKAGAFDVDDFDETEDVSVYE